MSKLLRYYSEGNIYFITSVTQDRQPLLKDNYFELLSCFEFVKNNYDIKIIAWILLPDHFHLLIDPKNKDLSKLIKIIKLKFSYAYREKFKLYRKTIWQKRYWDHVIRDQNDLNIHNDYIHYNPVKHGLVNSPFEWEFSSIHKFRDKGYYQDDWGVRVEIKFGGDFGE